jgi:UDP-N-acetylmuramoyl-L-alanyl-D-glutamate--2,6-diaminopimelate ligase
MKLCDLLESAGLISGETSDVDIATVTADSREVTPGSCYVAVCGVSVDGHAFIDAAVESGASAIVCQTIPRRRPSVPCIVADDTRIALGLLAQAFHGWPARQLTCIGITGTNGKTTIAHLIDSVLRGAGITTAMFGTISYHVAGEVIPAKTTTPDACQLAAMMARAVEGGASHLVMEVSSHALIQHRTAGMEFDVAVFTNLSGDHLDYHGSMDAYREAKAMLFASLARSAVAILNRDDPSSEAMAAVTGARIVWYGLSPAADVYARIREVTSQGSDFETITPTGAFSMHTPLIGRHNLFNTLAAFIACESVGVPRDEVVAQLRTVDCVPGRLEQVCSDAPFQVFVDYAHTDDALANVLGSLRPITQGHLIVVFGCGGDRDRTKRPRMARVARDLTDRMIVTTDNPRSEDPQQIVEDMLGPFDPMTRSRIVVELDRRQAIHRAIAGARAGDVVLIAGKGHETYQILGDVRTNFDDVAEANAALTQEQQS